MATEIYAGVTIYIPAKVIDAKDAGNIIVEACGKKITFAKADLERVCMSSFELSRVIQLAKAAGAARDVAKTAPARPPLAVAPKPPEEKKPASKSEEKRLKIQKKDQ
ncbi:hypothetical protein LCGC14_2616040 [marine sediment metagenome]|uniref:Uncharacterized protein n=1 Tax=marine sediment metagenome TaxID=412755 RepID=A0A0F9CX54_9ZZZZ